MSETNKASPGPIPNIYDHQYNNNELLDCVEINEGCY